MGAGLGEGTLRHLFQEYSLTSPEDISEEDSGPVDLQVALAVNITCKLDPEAAEETVTSTLCSLRFNGSIFDDIPELDLEWLKDNSLEKDVKGISEYVKKHTERKGKAKRQIEKYSTHINEMYCKSRRVKIAKKVANPGLTATRGRRMPIVTTLVFRGLQTSS